MGSIVPGSALVTGGGGFIGRQIVAALARAGHRVRVIDTAPAPADLPPEVDYRRGDLADEEAVTAAVDGVEAVCRQPARVGLESGSETWSTTSGTTTSPRRSSWSRSDGPGSKVA